MICVFAADSLFLKENPLYNLLVVRETLKNFNLHHIIAVRAAIKCALCVCSSWPGFLQLAKYENKLFLLTRTDKKIARISLQTLLIRTKNWRNETVFQTSNFDQNQARVVLTTIWGLWILSATFFRSVSSECEALDQRVRRVTQKIYNATPTSPGLVDTGL